METPAEADIVLLCGEAGLESLRDFRADGPAALLPAFDLTGRLGAACDGVFRVGDAESWSALAATSIAFAGRRATLRPGSIENPKTRLAALMHVADRNLRLASGDEATGATYETGFSRTALMGVVLHLMEAGSLSCEPFAGGVTVALTQAGREAVVAGGEAQPVSGGEDATEREVTSAPAVADPDATARPVEVASELVPVGTVNMQRLRELAALIGSRQVEALLVRLGETLDGAFAPGSDTQAIARQAHTLIATAGSLGFEHLAEACRALQEAIAAGADETRCLRDARVAADEARSICARRASLLNSLRIAVRSSA